MQYSSKSGKLEGTLRETFTLGEGSEFGIKRTGGGETALFDPVSGEKTIAQLLGGSGSLTVLYGSEEGLDSTSATDWVQAWRYAPTLEQATYVVFFYAEITNRSGSYITYGRVQINDTDTISELGVEPENIDDDEYMPMSGVYVFSNSTAGVVNFDFDFYSEGSSGTARIRRKRIVLVKIN